MSALPRVCVIGAGSSGITVAKALKDRGIPFDAIEMSDRVGGNWAIDNPNGVSSAYRSLHINTSRERMEYSDYPMPKSYPDFPKHTHIARYFNDYVDHFELRERIEFETRVDHADRHADDWHGKRVVVLGMGNSAMDIAVEASYVAEKVVLAARRGAHVVPKYIFGRPIDQIGASPRILFAVRRRIIEGLLRVYQGPMEQYGLPKPDHRFGEAHPTVSADLLNRVAHGEVHPKPNIKRLEGDRVRFADGSVEQADAIVYCTGYRVTFPFFG